MNLSLVQLLLFQACSQGFWAFTPSSPLLSPPLPSSPLLSCGATFLLERPPDVVVLTGLATSRGLCLSVLTSCTHQAPPLAARRA